MGACDTRFDKHRLTAKDVTQSIRHFVGALKSEGYFHQDIKYPNGIGIFVPFLLACLIVYSSECGKTILLLNLVYKNWVPYRNLYIFSKF